MYDELYRLFILNKELSIPGIGNFSLNRKPAEANFLDKVVYPPGYYVSFTKDASTPSKNFFYSLAELLNLSDRDAVVRFNDFAFDLRKKIAAGNEIIWEGIGTLSMSNSGNVLLIPNKTPIFEEPVAAEKAIREHAEHKVLVGEQERTSVEMTELLTKPEKKRSNWWITALVAGILLIIFLFWHFSKNNWNLPATSNQQLLSPNQPESTYTTLQ